MESNANSSVPVQLAGLTGLVAIASGGETSQALKSDGTVWAWGINSFGELGNGSNANSNVPVQVSWPKRRGRRLQEAFITAWPRRAEAFQLAVNPASVSFTADGKSDYYGQQRRRRAPANRRDYAARLEPYGFRISGTCSGASLAPTDNCTVTVTFGASAAGDRSAALLLAANAPGSPILVPLSGTGPIQPLAPAPTVNGVVSASRFGGFTTVALVPGLRSMGRAWRPDARSWTGADFQGNNAPTSLDGVAVTIGGQKAFVDYISPTGK